MGGEGRMVVISVKKVGATATLYFENCCARVVLVETDSHWELYPSSRPREMGSGTEPDPRVMRGIQVPVHTKCNATWIKYRARCGQKPVRSGARSKNHCI